MLISLDDMKTYLGIDLADPSQDDFLTQQLIIISDAIEGYCARKFELATWTQTFHSDEMEEGQEKELFLYHYPVTSIVEVLELDGATPHTVSEFRLRKAVGSLKKLSNYVPTDWFAGYRAVEVQYEAGFAIIPPSIQQVVYSLVSEKYAKKVSGMGLDFGSDVQSVSIPSTLTIQFDYTLQANERKSRYGMILGNYANVLDNYRSDRAIIGTVTGNSDVE